MFGVELGEGENLKQALSALSDGDGEATGEVPV
jgi:hypothetical protein